MRAVVYGCLSEFVVGKYSRQQNNYTVGKYCVYKLRNIKVNMSAVILICWVVRIRDQMEIPREQYVYKV